MWTAAISGACQTGATDSIAASHVEANVPERGEFERLIKRDLKLYLDRRFQLDLKIDYELLRLEPTQSGISYPKYYVWVRGVSEGRIAVEGAARVAALKKEKFELTDFLQREEIMASPFTI